MSTASLASPIRFYRFALSGHSHRVELFLSLLGLPVETVDVDLLNGAHKAPEFLARNPRGQVPVIEDGNVTLADSTAILVYLAIKYAAPEWLPRDAEGAARVQRYLSLASGEVASGPATARLATLFKQSRDLSTAFATADGLLRLLEGELRERAFLIGPHPTIADLACYTYIAHAPEGGISLEDFPHLRGWLARIEALPGFVPMQSSAVGLRVGVAA